MENIKEEIQNEVQNIINQGNKVVRYGYNKKYGKYLKNGVWQKGNLLFDTLINFSWINGSILSNEDGSKFHMRHRHLFINCTFINTVIPFNRSASFINCLIKNSTVINQAGWTLSSPLAFYNSYVIDSKIEDKEKNLIDKKYTPIAIYVSRFDNSVLDIFSKIELSELNRCKVYNNSRILQTRMNDCEISDISYIFSAELIKTIVYRTKIEDSKLDRCNIKTSNLDDSVCTNSTLINCTVNKVIWESGIFKEGIWKSGVWKNGTWTDGTLFVTFHIFKAKKWYKSTIFSKTQPIKTEFDPSTLANILRKNNINAFTIGIDGGVPEDATRYTTNEYELIIRIRDNTPSVSTLDDEKKAKKLYEDTKLFIMKVLSRSNQT